MGSTKRKSFLLTRIGCMSLAALASVLPARPQDTYCPAYPRAVRMAADRALNLDRQFAGRPHHTRGHLLAAAVPPSKNVIDEWIFRKMNEDGVDAALLTTDA